MLRPFVEALKYHRIGEIDEVDYAETFCQGIGMSSSKFDTAHSAATWDGSQNVTWTSRSACADQEGISNFGRALWNWWAWQAVGLASKDVPICLRYSVTRFPPVY